LDDPKAPSDWFKVDGVDELVELALSITKIRFGGSAVLTIQYQDYKITSADAVSKLR